LRIAGCQVVLHLLEPQTSAYVCIRQHMSAYVSVADCSLVGSFALACTAYASIRQHTPAYVTGRLFRSCFYRIRQHTSAYVSFADCSLAGAFALQQVQLLSRQLLCNNSNCSAPTLQLLFTYALYACLGAATTLQHLLLLCNTCNCSAPTLHPTCRSRSCVC